MQSNYVDWRDSTFAHLHDDFSNFSKTKTYITAEATDQIISLQRAEEEHAPPEKILICGPSNAAIDEIVRKMKKDVSERAVTSNQSTSLLLLLLLRVY